MAIYIIIGVQAHCIISEMVNISDMILIQRLEQYMINKQSQQDHIYGGKVFSQHCSIVLNKKCLTMSNLSSTDSSAVSLLRLEKVGTCTALHWKRRRKDGFNVFTNQSILHTYLQISRDFAIYSVNYVSARILAEIADRIPDRRSKDENTEKYKRLSPDVFHKLYINTRDVLRAGGKDSVPLDL